MNIDEMFLFSCIYKPDNLTKGELNVASKLLFNNYYYNNRKKQPLGVKTKCKFYRDF